MSPDDALLHAACYVSAVNCLPVCRVPLPIRMEDLRRLGVISAFPAHLALSPGPRTKAGMT